jgi:hypothetical protein
MSNVLSVDMPCSHFGKYWRATNSDLDHLILLHLMMMMVGMGEERKVQGFGGKARRKETTWKTKT